MDKYVSQPVEVEAAQFSGIDTANDIIAWILGNGGTARYQEAVEEYESPDGSQGSLADEEHLQIETLEGTMRADRGDWILKGTIGEFYPCKNQVFVVKYKKKES